MSESEKLHIETSEHHIGISLSLRRSSRSSDPQPPIDCWTFRRSWPHSVSESNGEVSILAARSVADLTPQGMEVLDVVIWGFDAVASLVFVFIFIVCAPSEHT